MLVLAMGSVMTAPELQGVWSASQGRDDYRCDGIDLQLDLTSQGVWTLKGAYSGPAIDKPADETFTILPDVSETDAARTGGDRIARFVTTMRTRGAMRFVARQTEAGGRPLRMEWQLRDRAGKPFKTLFWMQRCAG
jgi:hypothetical protein